MSKTYMLDTSICKLILRQQPANVLARMDRCIEENHRLVISTITYSELITAVPTVLESELHAAKVSAFCRRLDGILPWDRDAADETAKLVVALDAIGLPLVLNDMQVAGHALSADAIMVTADLQRFELVNALNCEDWSLNPHAVSASPNFS